MLVLTPKVGHCTRLTADQPEQSDAEAFFCAKTSRTERGSDLTR